MAVQEALSYGIPVVGFNVNGTSETVRDTENGFLLPQNSSAEQVAVCLSEHHPFFKQPEVRKKSYLLFKERFDAKKKPLTISTKSDPSNTGHLANSLVVKLGHLYPSKTHPKSLSQLDTLGLD